MKKLLIALLLVFLCVGSSQAWSDGAWDSWRLMMASPGAIGEITPAAGTFTGVTVGSNTAGGNETVNATLGSELITWTADGWNEDASTWTFSGGVLTHITGNTTAVTGTVTGALTVGRTVRVAITGTGGVATATYTLGGNIGTTIAATGAIAIVDFLTTTVDSELVITPANTCTVAITNISVKELTDATGDVTVQGNLKFGSPIQTIDGNNVINFVNGLSNSYLGNQAGAVTSGTGNTFVGHHSGKANTTGYGNTAVGFSSLLASTNNYGNTAIGKDTLAYDGGSLNTAVGYATLFKNLAATNTAIGAQALNANTSGDSNTAVGYNALYAVVGAYSSNTAIGSGAGKFQANGSTELTTPSQSVYIGAEAMGFSNSDSNSIVIGYQAVGTGANTVVIGNDSITATTLKGKVKNPTTQITVGATGTLVSEGHINRQLYVRTYAAADFTDADTTKGIVIATLPAKTKIVGIYADTTAAYTGGTVNACTLEVGITAEGAAEILAPGNVFAAAILMGDADAEMGTGLTRAAAIQGGYMPSWTGTTAIYATLDSTAGNLNALTTGSTTFYIETERF